MSEQDFSPQPEQVPPPPPREPAPLPRGFWARIDYLLKHSDDVLGLLRSGTGQWELARTFFAISILMAAIYGAVMGATNLLQGSPMALNEKLLLIVITALKVPVLYLVTLAIVLPPIYVSNAFVGARLPFRLVVALLLGSVAITSTLLASMATVSLFFSLTSTSYHFIKLLHVVFFVYSGLMGLDYLKRGIAAMRATTDRPTPGHLFLLWLLLYMFVGTQLAWIMRPFVGSPNEPFQVFRPRSGSFYESVLYSTNKFMKGDEQP